MEQRAWSTWEVKRVDPSQRIVEGIASTPTPDRGGDVMIPSGAQYALPIPFLWFHNAKDPIGEVVSADVRDDGIHIRARVSRVDTPGRLKTLVDEAWSAFTATPPLVRGLSIGWVPLEAEPIAGTKSGMRIKRWIWGELSAVTVPMNTDATIYAVKAADTQIQPGADPGLSPRRVASDTRKPMTTPEQITQFDNMQRSKAARMVEIMDAAGAAGTTLDPEQKQEYKDLGLEVKSIAEHLGFLRDQERLQLSVATPITPAAVASPAAASDARGGSPVIHVKSQLPKGTAFTRMCMALGSSKGDYFLAMERAKSWTDTPEVELMVKAAVAAGSTTDATWMGPFVQTNPINEFLELLRPRTLLGQIPGLRQVPFNISMPAQTTGGTYGWVGQNKPKPVTKADYATVTVGFSKAAGIIVLTEELVKLSTPSAEEAVRREMIDGMSQFLDVQFVDPTVAAVANVNPASVTNGAATAAASGTTSAAAKADLAGRVAVFTAAGIPLSGSVWLMNDSNAFGLSQSVNALAQPLFPGVGVTGGVLYGMPVIVSNNVGNRVILMHAPSILFADDGGVRIDVSREASVQMDSAPSDPGDASTVLVSLWQKNLVGLKAERFISWTRARTAAVTYISAAAYVGT